MVKKILTLKTLKQVKSILTPFKQSGKTLAGNQAAIKKMIGNEEYLKFHGQIAGFLKQGARKLRKGLANIELVSSVGGIKKFSLRILPKKVAAFIEEEEEKMGVLAVAQDHQSTLSEVDAAQSGNKIWLKEAVLESLKNDYSSLKWDYVLKLAGFGDPYVYLFSVSAKAQMREFKKDQITLFGAFEDLSPVKLCELVHPSFDGIHLPLDAPQVFPNSIQLRQQMHYYYSIQQFKGKQEVSAFFKLIHLFHFSSAAMKFSSFEKFEDRYRKNSDLLNSDFNKSSMLIQAAWTERQLQKAEQLKKEESMVKSLTAQLESQIKEKYEKERALLMQKVENEMVLQALKHERKVSDMGIAYLEYKAKMAKQHMIELQRTTYSKNIAQNEANTLTRTLNGLMPRYHGYNGGNLFPSRDSTFCGDDLINGGSIDIGVQDIREFGRSAQDADINDRITNQDLNAPMDPRSQISPQALGLDGGNSEDADDELMSVTSIATETLHRIYGIHSDGEEMKEGEFQNLIAQQQIQTTTQEQLIRDGQAVQEEVYGSNPLNLGQIPPQHIMRLRTRPGQRRENQ